MKHLLRHPVLRLLLWSSLILCHLPEPSRSQINTADLQGDITDPANAGIGGATVRVENRDTGLARETKTRENGDYQFLALPPGHYRVSASAAGFRPAVVEDVTLTIGQQARLPLRLEISTLVEAVVVSADAAVVETTRTSVATTIDQRTIENLATNGRSYINFTLLDSATTRDNQPVLGPAPTSGLNIAGQRARANMVSIDGADAIDNTVNGVRATLSQEAVQEFQIIKSGYAPEYGRASAATINIVSKQGTNHWKGSLFGYLRSRHGSAANAFAGEPNPGDTRTQAGLTLGGPARKDKTFVFLSFESSLRNSIAFSQIGRGNYGFRQVASPFGSGTLLLTPQQQTYVGSAPAALAAPYAAIADRGARVAIFGNLPGGPTAFGLIPNPLPASFSGLSSEAGNYQTTEETYFYSVRLDHQISPSHSAFIRASATPADLTGLPSNGQNQLTALNAFSRTANSSTRDLAVVGQVASYLNPNVLSEFRFQFARRGVGLAANSSRVAVEIPGIASTGHEPFAPVYRSEKRWQLTENLTQLRGSHTLKAGVDVNYIPVKAVFPLNQRAVFYFPAALAVDNPLISAAVTPALASAWRASGAPPFSAAPAYGFGLPEAFVQQFGGLERTTSRYKNTALGWFVQDSWKLAQSLTLNFGVRYDVEFTPLLVASSPLSEAGEKLLNVIQGIPRDTNNWRRAWALPGVLRGTDASW